ncbi:hypothetical protein [Flavobacterium olei]|uniref:hypothetical protein n=1 Tax=Flavobacterium olei TaxID=1886782 RepID=UPI003219E3D3
MNYKVTITNALILATILLSVKTFSQDLRESTTASIPAAIQNNSIQTDSLNIETDDLEFYKKPKPTPPWFVRRFKITAGVFIPVNGTNVRVGSDANSEGTEIDFEDNLGFKKATTTFLGNLQWRASRRSRFDLGYFHLDRSTTHQLQKTLEFGDHTYPVNATVDSYFKINMYLFSYGYAFFLKPKYELGLMIGTHTLATDIGIGLTAQNAELNYNDKFNFTAPLPDLGIWGGYAFTDKFVINGNLNYFSLKVNDFKGKIISYNLSVMYQLLPDLDLALGYSGMNFTIDVVKDKLDGHIKWGYNGPLFTVSYAFGSRKPFGE